MAPRPRVVPAKSATTSSLRLVALCIGAAASLACAYFATSSLLAKTGKLSTPVVESSDSSPVEVINHDLNDFKSWKISDVLPYVASAPALEEWGTYRPGYYFGMRTKTKNHPLSSGIMWAGGDRKSFRHETAQDELAKFEWLRHDGQHFGHQVLSDSKLGLDVHTRFVVPANGVEIDGNDSSLTPTWMQQLSFAGERLQDVPLVFYFGMDCDTADRECLERNEISGFSLKDEVATHQRIVMSGETAGSGRFQLSLFFRLEEADTVPRISCAALENTPVLELVKAIRTPPNRRRKDAVSVVDPQGDLVSPRQSERIHSFAVQLVGLAGVEVFVTYHDHLVKGAVLEEGADVAHIWQQLFDAYSATFEQTFQSKFLSSLTQPVDEETVESAKVCLSSLLGGMGFFQGSPAIGNGIDVSSNATDVSADRDTSLTHSTITLLTGTPSRAIFPRGFLWDEGFHQMVVAQWNHNLTLNVLQHWMNALHFFDDGRPDPSLGLLGWVPREMILGEDARSRVPAEFIDQRVNIANPPTFLLVVESLLDQVLAQEVCAAQDGCCDTGLPESVLPVLGDLYPRLLAWVNGMLVTQRGSEQGSFRWRGRSLADNKNIPNTLASGLDDYPRSFFPVPNEKHLDLHCWMLKAVTTMHRLHSALLQAGIALPRQTTLDTQRINLPGMIHQLTASLEAFHWSDQHGGFFDTGVNNESATFVPEVLFRCGNMETKQGMDGFVPVQYLQSQASFCPENFPRPVGPVPDGNGGYHIRERMHADGFALEPIPRIGYVSLFPFLLKLLPAHSPRLEAMLVMMEDPQLLYSDFGLRSLATTDKFYRRKNSASDEPYWRGPIWINVNYLALSALQHYRSHPGPLQARLDALYTKLRAGVVGNVFGQHATTGQFWEQYDDAKGSGMRGHPFTGWTSTAFNMLFERY